MVRTSSVIPCPQVAWTSGTFTGGPWLFSGTRSTGGLDFRHFHRRTQAIQWYQVHRWPGLQALSQEDPGYSVGPGPQVAWTSGTFTGGPWLFSGTRSTGGLDFRHFHRRTLAIQWDQVHRWPGLQALSQEDPGYSVTCLTDLLVVAMHYSERMKSV